MANATLTTRIRHTSGIVQRQAEAARQTFKHVIAHHKGMAEAYVMLQRTALTRAQWKTLVADIAVPDPRQDPSWNKDAPRAELVIERYKSKVTRLFNLWNTGTGHTGNGSAWEAYNGLVESLDHDTDLWKTRNPEARALKLTDGEYAKTRTAVFNALRNHCASPDALALTA
jgi:hypothetical protein